MSVFLSIISFRHRPLHTYMDINENFEDYHRRPTFPELFVTKLLVTQGTTGYQMQDMDIIFLLFHISVQLRLTLFKLFFETYLLLLIAQTHNLVC